ncbi:MAG TPA: TolC family protein [Kofleriaceae bacterium]|nr:TolC family protein [Kofleriaceae bacterium]
MARVLLGFAAILLGASSARADDSLTLDQAIQLALTRNERAAISDLQTVQADAAVERAHVAFLPVLNASGNDTIHPIDTPKNTAQGALTLQQPLIVLSAFPLLAQAKHNLDAQRAQTAEDKRQLMFDVAKAYFGVLLAQEVVAAAQKKLDTATADVADTDAQFKAQLVSSNDVTRAQISLSTSVRELSQDRSQLATAYIELGFIINAPAPTNLVAPTALLDAGKQAAPAADTLVNQSLAARPDLVARKDSALAAHDFAREPRYRYLPTLSLIGQLTATSNAGMNGHDVDGSIQFAASWSIYDAGARSADIRSRDAAAEIADLQTKELVRAIDSDVRTAATQLTAAQQALAAAQDAVTASRKSASETAILYKQGLAKAIELVDANEQRFTAEVSYAEAEFSVASAYLALRQAIGQGPLEEARK